MDSSPSSPLLSLTYPTISCNLVFLTTPESSALNKAQMQSPSNPNEMARLLSSSIMHYSCFLLISFSSSHFSNHSFCLLMNIFLLPSERETKQHGEKGRQKDGEASEWPAGASSVGNLWQGSLVFHHGLI